MSLGERFRDWGLPTAVAVVGAAGARLPIIATGGVRGGLDAAKALALGATAVGVGRPLLQAALKGEQACMDWLASFELELRTAVFLAGIKRASDLARVPIVVTGRSKAWLDQLAYRRARVASSRTRSR
jgi:isopentenyl-diphosphate delta-isomerase